MTDLQVEQGATAAWVLDITPSASGEADYAYTKIGYRESVRSDYDTVLTVSAVVAGAEVTAAVDTSTLIYPEYLWEVSLFNESGELVQRWRGTLYVLTALP